MFPIRCYTCNSVLAHHWPEYRRRTRNDEAIAVVLRDLGILRMCCRRMFLSHVDLEDIQYPNKDIPLGKSGATLKRFVAETRTVSCD